MPDTLVAPVTSNFIPSIDYEMLGQRLRAYRMGASLLAEDVASQLGVSRAAVYRMEKGEIVKIETIERLAQLLNVSVASLLGVDIEYYANAIGFFERMRQLEQNSDRIMTHFSPISLLLTSNEYFDYLREMLVESLPQKMALEGEPTEFIQTEQMLDPKLITEIDDFLKIAQMRKAFFRQNSPSITSLVGLRDLEHFLHTGLVGRLDLPKKIRMARIKAARLEVMRIAYIMESEPMNIQIGLIDDTMPTSTFQIFMGRKSSVLAVSSFRFGELPNIRNGIATVTTSTEAITLYKDMMQRLWKDSYKGKLGAQRLRQLLAEE